MSTELRRPSSHVGIGDHLCLLYEEAGEALPAAARFLKEGLDRGEHAMYVVDDHGLERVERALGDAGIDVESELGRGSLRFLSAREYCPLDPFDPRRMLARFRELEEEIAGAGGAAVRAAVEMTWALTVGAPLDLLADYESWGNDVVAHFTGASLCMYNRRRFPAGALERLLRAHPIVMIGGDVAPNPFYEPPEVFFAGEPTRRFEWMLEQLRLARMDRQEREAAAAREQAARARTEGASRSDFLVQAGRELSASLDSGETLRAATRLAVERLGDLVLVELVEGDAVRRIAGLHGNPEEQSRLNELVRELAGGTEPYTLYARLPDQPLLANDLTDTAAEHGPRLGLLRTLGVTAAMVVPLLAPDETVGALTVASLDPERRFGPEDLSLALELAGLAGLALDNARLYGAAVRAREDAQQANRAKMDFLSAMSHEVRTPLNAIYGYIDLIAEGVVGEVTEQQRDMLRRAKHSQDHLLGLIDDLLQFTRLEVGRLAYHIEDVPLAEELRNVEDMLTRQAQAKGVEYGVGEIDPGLAARCDRERLRQIVINLVGNAIKFTEEGGRVEIACEPEGELVLIRVKDTGAGIPPDQLEAIFDAFVQFGRDRKRSQPGVGLGLAISRSLARDMGGDLSAESEVGAGSRFLLRLPLAPAATLRPEVET